jgi:hypothetical protein
MPTSGYFLAVHVLAVLVTSQAHEVDNIDNVQVGIRSGLSQHVDGDLVRAHPSNATVHLIMKKIHEKAHKHTKKLKKEHNKKIKDFIGSHVGKDQVEQIQRSYTKLNLSSFSSQIDDYKNWQLLKLNATLEGNILELIDKFGLLVKTFKDFDECLGGDGGHFRIINLLSFAGERLKDPMGLFKDFDKVYVKPGLTSSFQWISEEMDAGMKMVQAELLKVMQGQLPKLDAATVGGLMDDVWAMATRLYMKPGMIPLRCFMDHFIEPRRAMMKSFMVKFIMDFLKPIKDFFDNLMNQAISWISGAVESVAKGAADALGLKDIDKRLGAHAKETAGEACMAMVKKSGTDLELAKEDEDLAAIGEIHDELTASMPAKMFGMVLASAISLLLNDVFSFILEKIADPILSVVKGALTWINQAALHVVNGIMGLIPEAGSAISGLITQAVDTSQAWVQNTLNSMGLDGLKTLLKKFADYKTIEPPITKAFSDTASAFQDMLKGGMKKIGGESAVGFVNMGMGAMVQAVTKVAGFVFPSTMKSMDECIEARKKLLEVVQVVEKRTKASLLGGNATEGSAKMIAFIQGSATERVGDHPRLLAHADVFHAQRLEHHEDLWYMDIPFQPTLPEHKKKWAEEHASLMEAHHSIRRHGHKHEKNRHHYEAYLARQRNFKPFPGMAIHIPEETRALVRPDEASLLELDSHRGPDPSIKLHSDCQKGAWKFDKDGKLLMTFQEKCLPNALGINACAKVPNISWQFGWKNVPSGCEFGNNHLMLGKWWCSVIPEVRKEAFINPLNFRWCFDPNDWMSQIFKILELAPKVVKMAQDVMGCVEEVQKDPKNAKYKLETVVAFFTEQMKDVGGLFAAVDKEYIAPGIGDLKAWMKRTVDRWVASTKKMVDGFSNPKSGVKLDQKWALGMVQDGWDTFAHPERGLVSLPGMGGAMCLTKFFIEPVYQRSKDLVATMLLKLIVPPVEFIMQAITDLKNWISDKITEALNGDNWVANIGRMVRAAIVKTCMDNYNSLNVTLLASQKNPKISSDIDLRTVAFNLIMPFVIKVKNWVLHTAVTPIAKLLSDVVQELVGKLMHLVDGLTGLVPFWGGLIGAVVSAASSFGNNILGFFNSKSIIGAFEFVFKAGVDFMKKLINDAAASFDSWLDKQMAGPFGPVMKIILGLLQGAIKLIGGPQVATCVESIETVKRSLS